MDSMFQRLLKAIRYRINDHHLSLDEKRAARRLKESSS